MTHQVERTLAMVSYLSTMDAPNSKLIQQLTQGGETIFMHVRLHNEYP